MSSSSSTPATVIKLKYARDVRRCADVSTFSQLLTKVRKCYPAIAGRYVNITYVDDEGDVVTVTNDAELAEAFHVAAQENRKSLRLNVVDPSATSTSTSSSSVQQMGEAKDAREAKVNSYKENTNTAAAAAAAKIGAATVVNAAKNARVTPVTRPGAFADRHCSTGATEPHPQPQPQPQAQAKPASSLVEAIEAHVEGIIKNVDESLESVLTASVVQADAVAASALSTARNLMSAVVSSDTGAAGSAASESKATESAEQAAKPAKPVPLRVSSGGAKIFFDGSVEHAAAGGDAEILPDGSMSCVVLPGGFPTVTAQGLAVISGKWYYEMSLLTAGCMQVGWVTPDFTGDAAAGQGVGDDAESWAYDGYRQLRWHGGANEIWGPKWKVGSTVCCALDADRGVIRFALDGNWPAYSESVAFPAGGAARGLAPAASLSSGERLRFNFGAPGTPLFHGPPDASYKPIWEAYSTPHNRAPAPSSRPVFFNKATRTRVELTKDDNAGAGDRKEPAPAPVPAGDVQAELNRLLMATGVRDAISAALSKPEVAAVVQAVMAACVTGSESVRSVIERSVASLAPICVQLVAQHPQLLVVVPRLLSALAEAGVTMRHPKCKKRRCGGGGGACRRANRSNDTNWRRPCAMPSWFGAVAETVAAAASSAAAAAAPAPAASAPVADAAMEQAVNSSLQEASDSEEEAVQKAVDLSIQDAIEMAKVASANATVTESKTVSVDSHKPRARFLQAVEAEGPIVVGQPFHHTWRIVNSGPKRWPHGVVVRCTGGDPDTGKHSDVEIPVAPVSPSKAVDISVNMMAPDQPGRFISYWRLFHGEEKFGDRFWVDVNVEPAVPPHDPPSYNETLAGAEAQTVADEAERKNDSAAPAAAEEDTSLESLADWVAVSNDMRTSASAPPPEPEVEADAPVEGEDSVETLAPIPEPAGPKHAQLIAMGFDPDSALAALAVTNQDLVAAVAHLTMPR